MTNSRYGRGRPSKAVYRRRRIIALAVVALTGWLLWLLLSSVFAWIGSIFNPQTDPANGVTPVAGSTCAPGSVLVEPVVANSAGSPQTAFEPGVFPYIGYAITNTGSVDCTFDVGAAVTYFTISSGSEVIWDSAQCDRTGAGNNIISLKAGDRLTSPVSIWYRVSTSPDTIGCGADQKLVVGEGASYHLKATVNGVISQQDLQFVLN
jgi:hypothetical protein